VAEPDSLLDRFLPRFDVATSHATLVRASPAATFAAVKRVDLGRSLLVRLLLGLRGLGTTRVTFERLTGSAFVLLGEHPGRELVLGIAGRFWTPTGHIRRIPSDRFATTTEPGTAKAVWGFRVEPAGDGVTRLVTSTRVLCADAAARRRFRAYWLAVKPLSGLIRRRALALARREAEAGEERNGKPGIP
jgi:hypothetical protein